MYCLLAGRSAPCTPSLAFPHSWQQRYTSPGSSKKALSDLNHPVGIEAGRSPKRDSLGNGMEEESRINYIVPCFEESSPEKKLAPTKVHTLHQRKTFSDVSGDGGRGQRWLRPHEAHAHHGCVLHPRGAHSARGRRAPERAVTSAATWRWTPATPRHPEHSTPSPVLAPKSRTTSTSDPEGKPNGPPASSFLTQ
ncbi:uncharacterized protein CEXT_655521 [Caerostris extrusa]|uniref:Uncharacterized protein n=1 Tax=Caerostris extrusa TaxID=172846 RepID=A0AAV4MR87_CAEEX|nr:uncharacterized protein CEXT_655521 [Caerostris extrusa]